MRIISYNILDGGVGRADPIAEVDADRDSFATPRSSLFARRSFPGVYRAFPRLRTMASWRNLSRNR